MKIMHVKWKDAASIDNWVRAKDFESELASIGSIGFLSKETEEALWLSGTVNLEEKEENLCACTIIIPKKMVIYQQEIILDN